MKRDEFDVDLSDDIEDTIDVNTSGFVHFKQSTILHGRVIIGFGGPKMCTFLDLLKAQVWTNLFLQGNMCCCMGKEEIQLFYINASGSSISNTSTVHGVSFTLTPELMAQILEVPTIGWCHYVKRDYSILDELPSALEISRRFANDPTIEFHSKVDKGAMLPLHKLLFNIIHKIILS
ncbi:hypothetical protein KY289_030593 [Solanum tuberosum]|nr:hypothetical protein KY289_030593 [Solanum tuberosum]